MGENTFQFTGNQNGLPQLPQQEAPKFNNSLSSVDNALITAPGIPFFGCNVEDKNGSEIPIQSIF